MSLLRTHILPAIILPLLAAGCMYERVDIYTGGELYSGIILSDHHLVEASRGRVILKPGGRFAIRYTGATQWIGQFEAVISEGEGMNVYLRTTPHKFDSTGGIVFHYATNGSTIRLADGTTQELDYNAESAPETISFYNEADLLGISVGCRRIFEQETTLPGSEYVIFETLPGSTVELRSVSYFDTNEE